MHGPSAIDFQGVLDAVEPHSQFFAAIEGKAVGKMMVFG
jgi:hypothetical protein